MLKIYTRPRWYFLGGRLPLQWRAQLLLETKVKEYNSHVETLTRHQLWLLSPLNVVIQVHCVYLSINLNIAMRYFFPQQTAPLCPFPKHQFGRPSKQHQLFFRLLSRQHTPLPCLSNMVTPPWTFNKGARQRWQVFPTICGPLFRPLYLGRLMVITWTFGFLPLLVPSPSLYPWHICE